MKVKEFIEKYNSFKNDDLKNKFVKERITTEYVPYSKKMDVCKRIVDATMQLSTEVEGMEQRYFHSSAAVRFFMQQIQLVRLYTDIEIHEAGVDGIEDFELLDRYGLIEVIQCYIPERELTYFSTIIQMYIDDYVMNENNLINYIETKINASGMVFGTILDQLKNITDNEDIKKMIKASIESNKNV